MFMKPHLGTAFLLFKLIYMHQLVESHKDPVRLKTIDIIIFISSNNEIGGQRGDLPKNISVTTREPELRPTPPEYLALSPKPHCCFSVCGHRFYATLQFSELFLSFK